MARSKPPRIQCPLQTIKTRMLSSAKCSAWLAGKLRYSIGTAKKSTLTKRPIFKAWKRADTGIPIRIKRNQGLQSKSRRRSVVGFSLCFVVKPEQTTNRKGKRMEIDCGIFRENSLVRFKVLNRMPKRRKLPVTDETAEKYLLEFGAKSRADYAPDEWLALVQKTQKELSVSKKLLDCPELEKVNSALTAIRTDALALYCNRSGIDSGLYLILSRLLPELRGMVSKRIDEIRTGLVPALQAVYPAAVGKVRSVWGDEVADKLPTVDKLPDLFAVSFMPIQFSVPEGLPPEIREQAEADLRESFANAKAAVVSALWEEFQGLIDHLLERLEPAPEGTKKVLKAAPVENIRAFLEAFQNRNAFGDERLASLVAKAGEILDGIGKNGDAANRLREFGDIREKTKAAFNVLKVDIDAGVTDAASRVFSFED